MMQLKNIFNEQSLDKSDDIKEEKSIVIKFDIDECSFCIDICECKEVIEEFKMTRLPIKRHGFDGVINVRGNLIPIISNAVFGKCSSGKVSQQLKKIIILDFEGHSFGLGVEDVKKVILPSRFDFSTITSEDNMIDINELPVKLVSCKSIVSLVEGLIA